MIVRDLLCEVDEVRVIARAIFEDNSKSESVDGWITKYYAQLTKLKNSKVHKSNTMFYLSVHCDDNRQYGDVTGFEYEDVKAGKAIYYAIEFLNYKEYASLYVPEYTVKRYGKEVVAAEALREYGWNGFDDSIICPDDFRKQVIEVLKTMKSGIFPVDKNYFSRCRKEFELSYEGKPIQVWEEETP